MYRRAHLLDHRPRHALAGHTYTPLDPSTPNAAHLHRCVRCHAIIPAWAITSGHHTTITGNAWCPDYLAALPPAPRRYRLNTPAHQHQGRPPNP